MQKTSVKFIAPNGARVTVKDWHEFRRVAPKNVTLAVIFNDPIFRGVA